MSPVIAPAMDPWLDKYPQFYTTHSSGGSGKIGEDGWEEVGVGRISGPCPEVPISQLVVSPLSVVPKKERGKFRLIHHLSFLKGGSINNGIDVICLICDFRLCFMDGVRSGSGSLMAKPDIESACHLLPVHPDSHYLLGCFFDGGFFVDMCLPMGCTISSAYFESFNTFLHWVIREQLGIPSLTHYVA